MLVRIARSDEYERVAELTVAAYRRLEVDHLGDGYEEEIRDTKGRAASTDIYVAVDDDNLLGAVTFVTDPDSPWFEWADPIETEIRLLAVDPDAQGRGVGEALVRTCVARATALGRPIVLHTTQWMPAAHRLYARLGFERRPDRDVHDAYPGWEFLAYTYSVRATPAG